MLNEIKLTLKELFTSYYDEKGIHGCRYNSLAWFHEDRHRQQMDIKFLNKIWSWLPYTTVILGMFMLWFLYLYPSWNVLKFGGVAILPITLFGLGLEIDANLYSIYIKIKRLFT